MKATVRPLLHYVSLRREVIKSKILSPEGAETDPRMRIYVDMVGPDVKSGLQPNDEVLVNLDLTMAGFKKETYERVIVPESAISAVVEREADTKKLN